MRKTKKIVSLVLSVLMVLSAFTLQTTFAADNNETTSSQQEATNASSSVGETNYKEKILYKLDFDNLTRFRNNVDFIAGGAYNINGVSLSSDADHTTGNGQSLKMANRTKAEHRIKFKDAFVGAKIGTTYYISAYVYTPEAAEKVGLGAYSDTGTANAFKPATSKEVDIPAQTWTKIEFEYTYNDKEITQIGIDQRPASVQCAPEIYIDDVKICTHEPLPDPVYEEKSLFELNFDNLVKFEKEVDFIAGGAYDAKGVSLSVDVDHTTGNGQSLKMANRTKSDHRVKFKNVFDGAQLGKTYYISAYVYTPEAAEKVGLGAYSDTGTANAFKPAASKEVDIPAQTWTKIEFEYKYDNEEITQIGIDQRPASVQCAPEIYIDDIRIYSMEIVPEPPVVGETIYDVNFDGLSSFGKDVDFITGGAYDAKGVSLSSDVDRTTGNGQSLKMANRTKSEHRVKFKNAFEGAQIGKIYVVSAYVYTPEDAKNVSLGAYSDVGKANAYAPIANKAVDVEAQTWTRIAFEYKYDNEEITQIGIDQRPASSECAPVIYVDDLKVYEGRYVSYDPVYPSVEFSKVHRPVPTNFTTGKGYEDLVFYEYSSGKSNDELIANLPVGTVMVDNSLLLEKAKSKKPTEYGTLEIIDVVGQPFDKAVRAKVTKLPEYPHNFQIDLGAPLEGKGTEGDVCLLKIYMRTLDGGNDESQNGQIQVVVEENGGQYTKSVTGNVTNGRSWNVAYFPFTFKNNYTRATVRLGYYLQTVEFGGYEIVNYGKNVSVDNLPTNAGNIPTLNKDAKWRKDAWDRIEKIRKGDIKVIVKDTQGNAVTDAKVDVNMYEHEFDFGSAVNSGVLSGETHADVIKQNFNTAVLENHTKWVEYEKNPAAAKAILKKLKDIGIKNLRGHVLVWDRGLEKTYDSATDTWKENTAVPEELVRLTLAGDRAGAQAYIKNHIDKITSDLSEYISEWDVLNEACNNKELQTRYGREIINEWYDMAREALGKDAKLYYNDFKTSYELFALLDTMYANNVDFDGIGLQSHYSSVVNIEDVIAFYNKLDEKYGKRLKVTEYDFATSDEKLQGNYTRDLLIATFAQESADGFVLWGYKGGLGDRYVLYDNNWNEKPGLNAWQDLIYNKWWTNESGTTSAAGLFTTSGFYGDYDITVTTKDGKTKTVSVPCHKGYDNIITITMD